MIEHRHLRYFMAVAEELNFSRAAERLHMAQPPLSAAIRKLERQLGTELLARTTREVRLTDAGATLVVGAGRILDELDYVIRATRRAGDGELGRVRLAFTCSTRAETLPILGRALRASHPDIELLTEEMWNVNVIPALRSGTVDVALCVCPELSSEVVCETVRTERIVALLPAGNPLASRCQLAITELADEDFMLVARDVAPRLHDTFVAFCRRAGFEPNRRSGGLQSAWELEMLGDLGLVSLAPESIALDLPGGLAAVPITEPEEHVETAIVARAGESSAAVQSLREVATRSFAGKAAA
jgi:DNA-binding transcriptional LysR family regulator